MLLKQIKIAGILTAASLVGSTLVLLLSLNNSKKSNHQYNSFLRHFVNRPIYPLDTLDIRYSSYYIAGATKDHFYFGNIQAPRHLLVANAILTDTQHVALNIKGLDGLEFRSIKVTIDSPHFYFADGTVPVIFRGALTNWYASRYTYDSGYFLDAIPISEASFALRTISSRSKEMILGKEMNSKPHVKLAPDLLQKQLDGNFCTDGMLHYSKDLEMLIYVYYYRNQFICADSSLNLLYRGNTIDSVSKAKINVTRIRSNNSITLSTLPLIVNRKSCVSNTYLFVNSNLLAKNEKEEIFENSSVIDVYNLEDGHYKFSFYLPKYKGNSVKEFQVFDSVFLALYDHYVIKFGLNARYFN